MSVIISWVGIDSRAITSAYIATDSRVSWNNGNSLDTYDGCRKTFYSTKYPELIAYCGDVLFPSLLITSIIENIDKGFIFSENDNAVIRYKKFKKYLFNEFQKYPKTKINSSFEMLYINRDNNNVNYPNFYSYTIKWSQKSGFRTKQIELPKQSGIIHVMGTGKNEFNDYYKEFVTKRSKGTSRNIYQCFAYMMMNIKEKTCGGAPQLVGIYRKPRSNGFAIGIIHNRKRYINGLNIGTSNSKTDIEWRNKYFERCDKTQNKRLLNAQVQENDLNN